MTAVPKRFNAGSDVSRKRNHMKIKLLTIIAAVGCLAAAVITAQAQPYYIAGDFQGTWSPNANPMTGGPVHYDYTITGQTAGNYANVRITDGTWSNQWPGGGAMTVRYDSTGSATVHFYPGTPGDGWLPLANRVGYDDPGNLTWGMAGDFDSWNGTAFQLAAIGNGVYSNSTVVATAGSSGFKFQSPPGSWSNIYFGSDFQNSGGNGTFTTTNSPQTVPVVLDLPNGRYLIGNLAPPPVTNQVVFAVDMTIQLQAGNFNPATDQVFVSGAFNNWPGTAAGALVLTNYPTYNSGSNTNIYYGTNTFVGLPNSAASDYKFTCSSTAYNGSSGYEPISNNRSVSLLATNGPLMLPVVKFGDLYLSDYVLASTMVTFSVNMTNAVSHIDGHVFDPSSDSVYINGNFLSGGWSAWNPIALTSMANDPVGSQIYTYTATVPVNSLLKIDYKYSMGYSAATNWDNEAPAYSDHFRYIRCTATGTYTNAQDTFGNQYAEPSFGQLTSASAAPGSVLVKWLGRPGVELQSNGSLASGSWQSIVATDGTNWITGSSSANGFMSQTNWPAVGQQFFRLIQAW